MGYLLNLETNPMTAYSRLSALENALLSDESALASVILSQGNVYYVRPHNGSDSADGTTPAKAFKTLVTALAACTANQNDTVVLLAESNTAANTTDYQTATLDWNKDLTHLIGINSGALFSSRSRVAFASTYVTASNLFTLSASGCRVQGIEFYAGVASAVPTGCFNLTGKRNVVKNCHIAGMGAALMDSAGAYSLQISGGEENLIEDCVIGQNTVTLGAAVNAVMYFAAGATRNILRRCHFKLYTSHATNCVFVRSAAGAIDRSQDFENCVFVNSIDSGSTQLTQAMVIAAGGSPSGGINLIGTTSVKGATDWNSADSGNVWAFGGTVTAGTFGLAAAVTR